MRATATNLGKTHSGSSLTAIFISSSNPTMRAVERAAAELAPTELPIFIVGESGTGKGTLATMIHRLSNRSEQELVKVNCQRLPASVGANENRPRSPLGLTPRQLRGTIFLDEVLDLPSEFQSQVMAILPEGDIEPEDLGRAPRVIAASRSEEKVLAGSAISRELYYRLRGVLLRIPPLRERQEDISLLANFLLNKYATTFGRSSVRLSARAEECFHRHPWPGNVRELENAIKTLLAVEDENLVLDSMGFSNSNTTIDRHAVAQNGNHRKPEPLNNQLGESALEGSQEKVYSNSSEFGVNSSVSLKDAARTASRTAEKRLISEVLQRTNWNRKRAARELNISYKALLYKLKQNGLSGPGTLVED